MTSKYKRGIFLILIISISFTNILKAQEASQDSVISKYKNIAYSTLPSWMVNGAVSTVKGSELLKSFTPNLANTLYGRLPGLTVIQNGNEPGEDSPDLYIRGLNTYGTGISILVIVDGVEGSFEQLTQYEIESISVLKDASATALYGSKGANGVLLVTTKRGTKGPLEINFSVQQGFTQGQRFPKFLGSYDYARLYNEALLNDGQPARYTDEDLNAYQNGSDPFLKPDVDWYGEVLRKTAPVSNYNLNFKGGNEMLRYFVSLNTLTNNGLYKKTAGLSDNSIDQKNSRSNVRANIDINLTNRLSASLLLGGSFENKSAPAGNTTTSLFNLLASVPPNAFPLYNPDNSYGGSSLYTNPRGDILENGFYTSNSRTLQSTFRLTEQLDMITKGLSTSALISFNGSFSGLSNKSRTYPRFSLSQDVDGNIVYNKIGQATSLSASENASNQWRRTELQFLLNYDRTFGNHKINAMMMFDQRSYSVAGVGLPYKYNGFGGRFTYANHEKYIGELSLTYNGTENFPKGHRWGVFPAVSLGWIVSKEGFLKESSVLDYLKIRGSYGMVGNDDIGGTRFMFNAQPYISASAYYLGTSNDLQNTIVEGTTVNPNVTWEKEQKLNLGFEATMFKRLDIEVDIFKNDRYDILAKPNRTVPNFFGMMLPDLNLGKNTNMGFETAVTYKNNPKNSFQYYVTAKAWYAKNKIVYNAEPIQAYDYQYKTGRAIGQPFLLEATGFFKDENDILTSPVQIFSTVRPGDLKYKDQNNDNIIDQNDFVSSGNTTIPRLTTGLDAGISFKGFDLTCFFQAVSDRSVYLSGKYYQAFQNNGQISSIALGRWTPETASTATYPRLSAVNNLNNFQSSSFWQRDGSFIKLRSTEFGYNLPEKFISKVHLNKARIFINGTNLFSFDKMEYSDPETLSGYPAVRTISIGASIQL